MQLRMSAHGRMKSGYNNSSLRLSLRNTRLNDACDVSGITWETIQSVAHIGLDTVLEFRVSTTDIIEIIVMWWKSTVTSFNPVSSFVHAAWFGGAIHTRLGPGPATDLWHTLFAAWWFVIHFVQQAPILALLWDAHLQFYINLKYHSVLKGFSNSWMVHLYPLEIGLKQQKICTPLRCRAVNLQRKRRRKESAEQANCSRRRSEKLGSTTRSVHKRISIESTNKRTMPV
jgi:hypothetical protein